MHGSAHAGFAAYDQMRAARAAEQAYRHHSSAAVHSGSLAASGDPLAGLHSLQAAAAASNSPTNTASSLDHHHVSLRTGNKMFFSQFSIRFHSEQ